MGIRVRNWEVLHCMRFTLRGISISGSLSFFFLFFRVEQWQRSQRGFSLVFEVMFVHLPVTERMLLSSFFTRAVSTVPILFFFLAMAANSNSCGTVQLETTDRAICSYFVGTGFSRFLFYLYLGRWCWSTRSSSRCLCTCSGECGDDRRTRIARQTLPIFPLYATPVGITVRPRGVMHENGGFMRFAISIIIC